MVKQPVFFNFENDPSLAGHTKLTPAQIADLLTFELSSTCFQYNGSIYEQKDGATIGSPVSANHYRESFEEGAITTSSYEPGIWKRYVDDTFYHPGSQKRRWLPTASKPPAFHPLHHGDRERQQTRLAGHRSFKRTWRPPYHQRIQEAHAHRSILSVWFTLPSISTTRYC